jgi:hypothetical protein
MMPAFAPPPSPRAADHGGSVVVRFGTAVGLGAVASLACVLPATMRISPVVEAEGTVRVWLALAAAALLPMAASVVVLRGAREGVRAFGGPGSGLRVFGVALWFASLVVGFALFGQALRAHTHHHGLAGVTFAFGALAFALVSALVCARIVAMARAAPPIVRGGMMGILGSLAILAMGYVGLRFVHGASQDAASYGAAGTVVDVLAFTLGAFFASHAGLAGRRAIALIGPPVAVVVAAVGLSTLRDGPVRDAIAERAPAFSPVVELVPPR